MDFDDLQIDVSSRQYEDGEALVHITITFRTPSGRLSEIKIRTSVENETALSLETTRENAWRRVRELTRSTLALTQTPAAGLLVHKSNREKVARGESTDDNIF